MSEKIIHEIFKLRTSMASVTTSNHSIHSMTLDQRVYDDLAFTLLKRRHEIAPWGDWGIDYAKNTITLFGIKILKGER